MVGASLAIVAFVALLGVAAVSLTMQCRAGQSGRCVLNFGNTVSVASLQNGKQAPKTFVPAQRAEALEIGSSGQGNSRVIPAATETIPQTRHVNRAPTQANSRVAEANPAADSSGPTRRVVQAISISPDLGVSSLAPVTAAAPATPPVEAIESATTPLRAAPQANARAAGSSQPAAVPTVAELSGVEAPTPAAPLERTAAAPSQAQLPSRSGSSASAVVGGAGVNVRSKPSMSGGKLFSLPPGEKVAVTETQNGWRRIVDDKGRAGWAYSSFLSGGGK